PDWTFETNELFGRGVIRVDAPPPWGMKSVAIDGRDMTDSPVDFRTGDLERVEVTLSSRWASLSGTVTEGDKAAADYTVILFAEDSAKWTFPSRFVRSARPNQTGAFSLDILPAATYLAIALPAIQGTEWQDPEFLEKQRP